MNRIRICSFCLLLVFVLVSCENTENNAYGNTESTEPRVIWKNYKKEAGKVYKDAREDKMRYVIWMRNYNYVQNHNKLASANNGFKLAMNDFCDRSSKELSKMNYGLKLDASSMNKINNATNATNKTMLKVSKQFRSRIFNLFSKPIKAVEPSLPKYMNWSEKGMVSPVKNQGKCGACWSFVTTGVLESHLMIKNSKLNTYSEQNLMDCTVPYGNEGCDGGLMSLAFDYLVDNRALSSDSDYKYIGKIAKCKSSDDALKASTVKVNVTSYLSLPKSEAVLQKYIALNGPVAVGIDGNHRSFVLYKSGVYYEPKCSSTALNHAILVVGYGTDENKEDYWLIKNSWGTKWGEKGFGKIARNRENHCGIASLAGIPIFE